jgi:hypothetical protein
MTLLRMKVGGLGLILLGGLALAHGVADGRMWEAVLGLLMLGLGVVLLAAKVIRRTAPPTRDARF